MIKEALKRMSTLPPHSSMDVIIVVTSNPEQEYYWYDRLATSGRSIIGEDTLLLVVSEDWPGGAGNGLGTLYAFARACEKAQRLKGINLHQFLRDGASIAMYHTAGKGKRLAPLPGAEHNNKPAVKLPYLYTSPTGPRYLTLLEAVIRQTSIFAPASKGRLSVFWGDQIFVPDQLPSHPPVSHAALLTRVLPMPDEQMWIASGLSQYGLVGLPQQGEAFLLEKVPYSALTYLQTVGKLTLQDKIGASLGCFNLSAPLVEALLEEFASELRMRSGKLDSDPHFWMPLTLTSEEYVQSMAQHGVGHSAAEQHQQRMTQLKNRLLQSFPLPLFSAIDVGAKGYWWDFGTLAHYFTNSLLLTHSGSEAEALRTFLPGKGQDNALGQVDIDTHSYVQGSRIERGTIRNSVVVGVNAEELHVENCVLINCTAHKLSGTRALFYDVVESGAADLIQEAVRADTFLCKDPSHAIMTTQLTRDGKADWEQRLEDNPLSFAELYEHNSTGDLGESNARSSQARLDIWSQLTL